MYRENLSFRSTKIGSDKWVEHVRTAFSVDPRIALSLTSRFPTNSSVTSEVTMLVQVCSLIDVSVPVAFLETLRVSLLVSLLSFGYRFIFTVNIVSFCLSWYSALSIVNTSSRNMFSRGDFILLCKMMVVGQFVNNYRCLTRIFNHVHSQAVN